MKKLPIFPLLLAAIIYLALFVLASSCGLIHPACYAYAGTIAPLFFAFVYLFSAAKLQSFGTAAILNGFVLIIGLLMGEGNAAMIVLLILLTVIAEIVRKLCGHHSLKGVRRSFIPFAFSFYAYSAHWWTNSETSLAEAVEEMPVGYAEMMERVISNIPMLIVMLILTVPVAILGMRLAEKVLKKQAASLRK